MINAYKEFLDEYKAVGGKIVQFDDCLWELLTHQTLQVSTQTAMVIWQNWPMNLLLSIMRVVDYTHELGLTVWTHNCRGNYEIRSASEGTYEDIAKKFLAEQHYDRFFLEWDSDTAGDIKALEALKDSKAEVVFGLLSS